LLFAVLCYDKEDSQSVRVDNRPNHLKYLNSYLDEIHTAGPILGCDSETPIGSLLILDFDTEADVRSFIESDPYNEAGLFKTITIHPWRKVFPVT